MVSVIFDCKKGLFIKITTVFLALVMVLPYMKTPTIAAVSDGTVEEAIEAAFTDENFLAVVRELVGKTDGEHIYRTDVEGITELVVNGYYVDGHYINGPRLKSLDGIEYFTGLEKLDCGGNDLYELDLSHNPNLKEVLCYGNYHLITLDLSHNPKLEVLDCSFNYMTSLDISSLPALRWLDCNCTDLQKLDVSQNTELTTLICGYTYLEELDVSQNVKLTELRCYETELRSLDISKNVCLETLEAWGGHLVNLDVSNNPRLKYLDLEYHDMCAVDCVKGLENCAGLVAGDTFLFEPQNGPTGQHTPGTVWDTDGSSHWHTCTVCGAEQDRAEHIYDDDRDAVCDTCGYERTVTPPVPPTPAAPSGSGGSSYSYYAITATAGEGGRIDPDGRVRVREGRDQTFAITPDEGYVTVDVVVDGESVGAVGEYAFEKVSRAHKIEAVFREAEPEPAPCPGDESCPIRPYTDASSTAWYHDGVHCCIEKGLMSGYGHGKFGPGDTLTRGMLVQILYNEAGRPAVSEDSPFGDVSGGAFYAGAVTWASGYGLVNGFGDGTFRPEEPVTREQIAVILYRYAACKGGNMASGADLSGYTDSFQISPYAQEAMAWARAEGFINGTDWGGLQPRGYASRAETAAILMRFCKD